MTFGQGERPDDYILKKTKKTPLPPAMDKNDDTPPFILTIRPPSIETTNARYRAGMVYEAKHGHLQNRLPYSFPATTLTLFSINFTRMLDLTQAPSTSF